MKARQQKSELVPSLAVRGKGALSLLLLWWVFPLTHTCVGWSREVFESAWAPLHFAWILGCAALLDVARRTPWWATGDRGAKPASPRQKLLWWGGLGATYGMTVLGCQLVGADQARGVTAGLLFVEYAVLVGVVVLFARACGLLSASQTPKTAR